MGTSCEVMPIDFGADCFFLPDVHETSKEQEIEEVLNCPCIDDAKRNPCGEHFSQAFTCFLKSEKEEQVEIFHLTFIDLGYPY